MVVKNSSVMMFSAHFKTVNMRMIKMDISATMNSAIRNQARYQGSIP